MARDPELSEAARRLAGAAASELHQLAALQLTDVPPAIEELARRYVVNFERHASENYGRALGRSYAAGYRGEKSIWSGGRGGNFAAGHRRAWKAGRTDRADAAIQLARGLRPSEVPGRPISPELRPVPGEKLPPVARGVDGSSEHRGSRR